MSGLLTGKRIVVTGVLTDDSLAYAVAKLAQLEGAEVVLTGAGRGLSLTRRVARHLPSPPDVLELDVTVPEHVGEVAAGACFPMGSGRRPPPLHRLRTGIVPRRRVPRRGLG